MAWIFSLSAECGPDIANANTFGQHFNGFTANLRDGSQYPCDVSEFRNEDAWWVRVVPQNVTRRGIENEQQRRELTEIGYALYERLRTARAFRFALVGVEVDGFRSLRDLDEEVINLDLSGLVISEEIWRRLGSPDSFTPFAEGYVWRPFTSAR
jgi:hypothetical protein